MRFNCCFKLERKQEAKLISKSSFKAYLYQSSQAVFYCLLLLLLLKLNNSTHWIPARFYILFTRPPIWLVVQIVSLPFAGWAFHWHQIQEETKSQVEQTLIQRYLTVNLSCGSAFQEQRGQQFWDCETRIKVEIKNLSFDETTLAGWYQLRSSCFCRHRELW